jgi:5-methylthioadenosine/S-adenosylhomocysteine deaminase
MGNILENIFIKDATVVTCDGQRRIINKGAVAIRGGEIIDVGETARMEPRYADFSMIQGSGKAVLPGFVNSHTHTVLTVLRGAVEDMEGDAVYGYMSPISYAMKQDERAAMAKLGCLEAIQSGTTTLVDPFRHVTDYAREMAETGLRLFLSENVADALTLKIRSGIYEYDRAWGEQSLERTVRLVEKHHNTYNGRLQCQIAAHAPDNCSPWVLERLMDLAKKYKLRRTIHLAQSRGELEQVRNLWGRTPTEYLQENGWLGPDLVAAHWTFCTAKDIEILAGSGTHMAHCPANSSRRGPHQAPFKNILGNGINIALGTDNMTEDVFHALKIGLILYRGGLGGGVNPNPQLLLDATTRHGALALGRQDDLGSIEPRKRADLTLINLNRAHLRPILNLTSNLVHYGHPGAVESVMVNGKFVMFEGKVLTMNEEDTIKSAQEAAESAWRRLQEVSPDIPMPSVFRETR